jgi:hypothetical protein
MALTIDEVTAEVAPPEENAQPAPRTPPPSSPASERRRLCQHLDRVRQRAARVYSD